MAQVKVVNSNSYPFEQEFRSKRIFIPANEHIVMEHEDAKNFVGAFSPIKRDADGRPLPESYKRLHIEVPSKVAAPAAKPRGAHACMACAFEAKSKAGLMAHVRSSHIEQMIDDNAQRKLRGEAPLPDDDLPPAA